MNASDLLSTIANIIQVLTFIPVAYITLIFLRRKWRYKKRVQSMTGERTSKPMALAISTRSMDISQSVKDCLGVQGLKDIPVKSIQHKGDLAVDKIYDFVNEVNRAKIEMEEKGVTEVHLFMLCPVVAAALVGALLDNWCKVLVYHHDSGTGKYVFWAILSKGTVAGMHLTSFNELIEEAAN
jgi:hypothetical protein